MSVKYVPSNNHETGYLYPTWKSMAIIGNKIPGPKMKSCCSSFKFPVFLPGFMIYLLIFDKRYTTDASSGAATTSPFGPPEFTWILVRFVLLYL